MPEKILLRARTARTGLRIQRDGDERLLRFDGDRDAIQSSIADDQPHVLRMENLRYLMGILLFLPPPRDILLLGVGGGALIHFLRYHLPGSHITAVDYDAELLELAHHHLDLPRADDRLCYVVADAREYARNCAQSFDLVLVDIFNGPFSPTWLLSREMIETLQACLGPRGGIAYNLLIKNENTFTGFYRLLRRTYKQQTLCLETAEYQNLLIYALNFSCESGDMSEWMQRAQQADELYKLPFHEILATIYSINPVGSGII